MGVGNWELGVGSWESGQVSEVGESGQVSEVSESGQVSEVDESSESGEVSESSESGQVSEVDESSEVGEVSESSESAQASESGEVSQASEATVEGSDSAVEAIELTSEVVPNQQVLQILSPTPDEALPRPAATVVIQAPIDSIVTIEANGVAVDPNQIGQVSTDGAAGVMRQIWYGVVFGEGENLLTATATLPDGTVQTTQQTVMVRGAIESLHLETLEAQVPADGRSTVTVRGYFLDKNGNLSNRGGRVTLTASDGTFVGADLTPDVPGFQVDANQGEFRVELQSSSQTGLVQIRAEMLDLEADTQVQFGTPQIPDGIVAGVIDLRIGPGGTDYFSRFGDFLPLS